MVNAPLLSAGHGPRSLPLSLHCQNLSFSTGNRRRLFSELNVRFEPGTLTGIVGINGAGKSTLLRILAGLQKPQTSKDSGQGEGAVYFNGRDIQAYASRERARLISYLPQRSEIHYDISVRNAVLLGRFPYTTLWSGYKPADYATADAALESVDMSSMASRSLRTLSGGEFQRVMLARMLAGDSPCLLLDEPTTALDIRHSLDFLELCRKLTEAGKEIILVIHELELAYRYCDRILLLGSGDHTNFLIDSPQKVLRPEVIRKAFGVEATIHNNHLLFSHPSSGPNRTG